MTGFAERPPITIPAHKEASRIGPVLDAVLALRLTSLRKEISSFHCLLWEDRESREGRDHVQ